MRERGLQDLVFEFKGRQVYVSAHQIDQEVFAQFSATGIGGFGDSVSEQDQAVAGKQIDVFFMVGPVSDRTEYNVFAAQSLARSVDASKDWPVMSRLASITA